MSALIPHIVAFVVAVFIYNPPSVSRNGILIAAFVLGFLSQIPAFTGGDPNPSAAGFAFTIAFAAFLGTNVREAMSNKQKEED